MLLWKRGVEQRKNEVEVNAGVESFKVGESKEVGGLEGNGSYS